MIRPQVASHIVASPSLNRVALGAMREGISYHRLRSWQLVAENTNINSDFWGGFQYVKEGSALLYLEAWELFVSFVKVIDVLLGESRVRIA